MIIVKTEEYYRAINRAIDSLVMAKMYNDYDIIKRAFVNVVQQVTEAERNLAGFAEGGGRC